MLPFDDRTGNSYIGQTGARFLKNLSCNPRRNSMLPKWAYVYEQS